MLQKCTRQQITIQFLVLYLSVLGSFSFVESATFLPPKMPVSSPTSVLEPPSSSSTTSTTTAMAKTNEMDSMVSNPRSCILQVGVSAGRLCGVANSHLLDNDDDDGPGKNSRSLVLAMTDLLRDLHRTSQSLNLNIIQSIHAKLELNNRKYPVALCKGKSGKYTQYSNVTGVTETNQTTDISTGSPENSSQDQHRMIEWSEFVDAVGPLAEDIRVFAEAREWTKFHSPRNIVLALLGEVGELAELLQWKGDEMADDNGVTQCSWLAELERETLDKLSQEIADVSIYLLRLSTVCNVVEPLVEELRDSL